jgi:hypothetical protein
LGQHDDDPSAAVKEKSVDLMMIVIETEQIPNLRNSLLIQEHGFLTDRGGGGVSLLAARARCRRYLSWIGHSVG